MNNGDYDNVREYVKNKVGEDNKIQLLIFDFAILWNIYEKELYKNDHHINNIYYVIKELSFDESYDFQIDQLYWRLFEYLRIRGYVNSGGEFNCDKLIGGFNLRLRERDGDNFSHGDIDKYRFIKILNSNKTIDRLQFMLIIAARVRNNMFHGLKDISLLKENEELFVICNMVLKLILDIKK